MDTKTDECMRDSEVMPREIVAWETTGVRTWRPLYLGHNTMTSYTRTDIADELVAALEEVTGYAETMGPADAFTDCELAERKIGIGIAKDLIKKWRT